MARRGRSFIKKIGGAWYFGFYLYEHGYKHFISQGGPYKHKGGKWHRFRKKEGVHYGKGTAMYHFLRHKWDWKK